MKHTVNEDVKSKFHKTWNGKLTPTGLYSDCDSQYVHWRWW